MVEFPKWLDRFHVVLVLLVLVLHQNLNCCFSLNDEGLALLKFREGVVSDPFGGLSTWNDEVGVVTPCSWSGIECADGYVVSLNLKDLCLRGSIAPVLANLIHIKSIILRNNSFYGTIPEDITKLKELEVLDLGYNNLSGALPPELGNNLSLTILLLDNNGLFNCLSPEIYELQMLSEAQVDENLLRPGSKILSYEKTRNIADSRDIAWRRMLQSLADVPRNVRAIFQPPQIFPLKNAPTPSPTPSPSPSPSPYPSPSPSPSPSPFPSPSFGPSFSPEESFPSPVAPASEPSLSTQPESPSIFVRKNKSSRHHVIVLSSAIGASVLLLLLVAGALFCRSSKVAVVKPWATGLSGQLQKAFVTGVPKLNRLELVTACEDFSNVIGTTASGTLYKGTLSSGVEIAALAFSMESPKDWSRTNEILFRKKIETLSKVNHKNFVNLLGYCEEEQPFTRMMVFEYAPNGTLFEHLHSEYISISCFLIEIANVIAKDETVLYSHVWLCP
ncbi:OLC1v1026871C1 [Oldenlandia corymbosa var. corymbosa]|uniref:OLC1v1026871C1 n=1 Tax=Oldenlandia corymbosa var. corymbosa TaxID=529605 RepID=A0AAV1C8M2_OLDCO|nr:OLC1v1026871C1 [Oldenlandia corymbosa var. corymbosa]